ncbi:MAG: S-layer homology domain-containing protein [Oscillospiraceae bacterium]|jgi:hypothetical protein|nr:S-layer homology domain-containing protein [Oscillospiraceae bacterium]
MKTPTQKILALLLAVALAGSLGIAALANDTTIEFGSGANSAPIAENLEYETFKGVALTGKFKALDPDGDALTFEITSAPKKGSVTPTESSEFVYTPADKSKGKDSFAYVAVDENGGVSASATVTVNIKKQSGKTTYADMGGEKAHYAALVLSERGVFTGEKLGDEYFFRPGETVTRGEFLAMCLKLAGSETIDGITKTGFSDDVDIPMWVKPYVSAGLMKGIVGGYRDESGRLVFSPNEPVTFAQAAVIVNKTLGITDVTGVAAVDDESVPAWARSASANLTACDILPGGLATVAGESVTRSDAAQMLFASAKVLDARDEGGGLLGWAK